jgi:hypothetical protein
MSIPSACLSPDRHSQPSSCTVLPLCNYPRLPVSKPQSLDKVPGASTGAGSSEPFSSSVVVLGCAEPDLRGDDLEGGSFGLGSLLGIVAVGRCCTTGGGSLWPVGLDAMGALDCVGESFDDDDGAFSVVAFAAGDLLAAVSAALDVVALAGCGADSRGSDLVAVVGLDVAFCDEGVDIGSCTTGVGAAAAAGAEVEAGGVFETRSDSAVAVEGSCESSCDVLLFIGSLFIEEAEDGFMWG